MRFVFVTGMSGAGKTTALKMLEDIGFYCVDNLPVLLIETLTRLAADGQEKTRDIALGIDSRNGEELSLLKDTMQKWRECGILFSILFLDASDEVLIKRYKETRRSGGSIWSAKSWHF